MDLGFLPWLVGAIVIGGIINAAVQANSGTSLAQKFAAQNPLAGKTKEQIIAAVGPPSAFSALPGGCELLQWQHANYHVALRFRDGVCEGVTHESLVKV